jgi:stage IV sporulation protein A
MIRTEVETEVSPAVGGGKASDEILGFLLQEFEGDASKLWESNLFGKSLYDIASESLSAKIRRVPENARGKFRDALERIVNEGGGGLICIIL